LAVVMARETAAALSFAQRERLRFVESTLFWEGAFTRARVHDVFGISANHVTSDLRWYEDAYPKSLVLDARRRRYVAGPRFKPRFASDSPAEYLALQLAYAESGSDLVVPLLGGGAPIATEAIPSPAHGIDRTVLQHVVQAIRNGTGIDVVYHSMRADAPARRTLWPFALVHTGLRWHARAFDDRSGQFRTFALQRMEAPQAVVTRSPQPTTDDAAWMTTTSVVVVPHPGLNEHQRKVVAREFGMKATAAGPEWAPTVRHALVGHFARRYELDVREPRLPQHRVVLKDPEKLRPLFLPESS
jgi:hypothetical protein